MSKAGNIKRKTFRLLILFCLILISDVSQVLADKNYTNSSTRNDSNAASMKTDIPIRELAEKQKQEYKKLMKVALEEGVSQVHFWGLRDTTKIGVVGRILFFSTRIWLLNQPILG